MQALHPKSCSYIVLILFLFCLNISFCFQSLCTQDSSTCCTSYGVMRQTNEFPVIYRIFSQTSYADTHTVFKVDIHLNLWTVIFFQILDELLRSARKFCFLRESFEVHQFFDQLFFGRILSEFYKDLISTKSPAAIQSILHLNSNHPPYLSFLYCSTHIPYIHNAPAFPSHSYYI